MDYLNEDENLLEFLAFLNGEFNESEKKEFEKRLNESQALKDEFEKFRNLWANFDKVKVPTELNIDNSLKKVTQKIYGKDETKARINKFLSKNLYHYEIFNKRREVLGWAVRFAAMLLLTVFSYQVFMTDHTEIRTEPVEAFRDQVYTLQTPKGKKADYTLPDGTKVFLNADSKVTYNSGFNDFQRSVALEGEAYFEVAHNKEKPFFVTTNSTGVRVVGTKFNIYARDNDFSLAVVEGCVRAFHKGFPSENRVVVKDEMVELREGAEMSKPLKVDVNQFLDWRNNKLAFRNEPLEKVMQEVGRTFNVNASFSEDSLRSRKLTGAFDASSLDEILTAISISLNVDIERSGNSVIVQ